MKKLLKMHRHLIVLALFAVGFVVVLALAAQPIEAHQTDTPHVDHYNCEPYGNRLRCAIYIHNPVSYGDSCTHAVQSPYLDYFVRENTGQGCRLIAWFEPLPPQRSWMATVKLRDPTWHWVADYEGLSWSAVPPDPTATSRPTPAPYTPTPEPTATPAPQDPYFTDYTCDFGPNVVHCTFGMVVPEGYNEDYMGSIDSVWFQWGVSDYDYETRTWQIDAWFEPGMSCNDQFAWVYVLETDTMRLLDGFWMIRTCD